MKKVVTHIVLVVSLMFTSIVNASFILSLDPATPASDPGDVVSVAVMIDGLGNFEPLSLGGFDLEIAFDANVLSFSGYSLFDNLGDINLFEADDFSWGEYAPGIVNLSEISYLFDFELWDIQPSSFALAELFFTVDASAANQFTSLSFENINLTDALGDAIFFDEVNDASIAIPAPDTLVLMCLGLLAMLVRYKHRSIR